MLTAALIAVLVRLKRVSEIINTTPSFENSSPKQTASALKIQKKRYGKENAFPFTQDDNATVCSSDSEQDGEKTVYFSGADRADDKTVCSPLDMQEDETVYSSDTDSVDDRTVYEASDNQDENRTVYSSNAGGNEAPYDSDRTVLQPEDGTISVNETAGKTSRAVRICLLNRNTGESWNLTLGDTNSVIIGRDPACQVCLNEKSVSQYHSILFVDDAGKLVIENKSQSNITKLNGYDLRSPQVLREGDEIKCGRVVLAAVSISSL